MGEPVRVFRPDLSGRYGPSKRNLLDTASIAQNLDGNRLTGSLQTPVSGYLDRHPLQRKGRMGPWLPKQPSFEQFIDALTVVFDTERFIELIT